MKIDFNNFIQKLRSFKINPIFKIYKDSNNEFNADIQFRYKDYKFELNYYDSYNTKLIFKGVIKKNNTSQNIISISDFWDCLIKL